MSSFAAGLVRVMRQIAAPPEYLDLVHRKKIRFLIADSG
jgi:hypothetical protein